MDYTKKTDTELTAIRKSIPRYLNEMTGEQQVISQAVYAEQKQRYDKKKTLNCQSYNRRVKDAGYKVGDRVSLFTASWAGWGGELLTGKVAFRKKYFVKLDTPFNGKKSAHLTGAWKIEK